MITRPAMFSDAPAVAAVHVAAWRAAYRGQMPDEILDGLDVAERTRFWIQLLASNCAVTVAEEGTELTGFCSMQPSRDSGRSSTHSMEISSLYVAPEHWRRGAGRALCLVAIDTAIANGYSKIILWVLASNTPAIRFYEAMGFLRDGGTKSETAEGGFMFQQIRMSQEIF